MERLTICIVEIKGKRESALQIEVDEETSENIIIKANVYGSEIVAENYHYLSAFREFQDKMLCLGFGLKCNGARLNAIQSPMMSGTEKVYLVEMGRKAAMRDVASMWDYAEIDSFPDSNQQEAFFKKWVGSWLKEME